MYQHKEADRIPIIDSPWSSTIDRWHREGMPEDVDYVDYFGLDKSVMFGVDNSPRYEEKLMDETDEFVLKHTRFGVTMREWKFEASTPQFLDFTVVDPESWEIAKKRMQPDRNRIDWKLLKENYPKYESEGYWRWALLWFGFDVTHSWMVGTERMLIALIENPEWCKDMFSHMLELNLTLLDMVWDEGYRFDAAFWFDDMAYRGHTFFSLDTYREILKPYHQRAIDWAHAKGIKAHLHTDGDIKPFIPEFISMGLDGLNPLEVKAGMDPVYLKQTYGDDLLLHGGINAVLWDDLDAITKEMRKVVPVVKESGGYVFSSDHSVPSSVSLENFRHIVNLAKELGSY